MEYLDLVDEQNKVLGKAPRHEVRAKNLLHRGVGIMCWNSAGQLYVHKRTDCKDVFPSMYDMMVGGAVEAGEDYDVAALREVQEELGVGQVETEYLLEYLYKGPKNYSWIRLYQVTWDGPISWQPEEICWGQWMDFPRVLEWVEEVPIVPDGLSVFKQYLKLKTNSNPSANC